ncbi:MAG: glycosyltransferase family 39 protein [Caldilineaceae bacterium]
MSRVQSTPVTARHSWRQQWWLLFPLLILLLAGVLRFYRLDASSLWSDEGNTWALLDRTWGQIAQAAAADIHPPGYYWLLKLWTLVTGRDAWGMRSFSAVTGLLVVCITYRLGWLLDQHGPAKGKPSALALVAALGVAVAPFQLYYSQEARMYMLLTLASASLFWALLVLMNDPECWSWLATLGYWGAAVAGLWTHYIFPVVLAAASVAYLIAWGWPAEPPAHQPNSAPARGAGPRFAHLRWRHLLYFGLLNGAVLLAYWPWLPTAIERLRQWPSAPVTLAWSAALIQSATVLLVGPLHNPWPWLPLVGLLPLLGAWRQRVRPAGIAIVLWLLAPIGLMFGAGLFTDAFMKFLLVASPAWWLLTASAFSYLPGRRFGLAATSVGAALIAAVVLPSYYTDPAARDNYAGIARYIEATADPATALVVLDAPGQQEVWRYYDPGVPVVALPQQRPPDHDQTLELLASQAADRTTIFALFWATNEADPEQWVEGWLNQHAFKGVDSWQGNLRLAVYSQPGALPCQPMAPAPSFGDLIQLVGICQPALPQQVTPGAVALVGLQWQALQAMTTHYKVTLQVLDTAQQVIAQRDSEPVGGSAPTTTWQPGQTVLDNHGILIPFGTPPGRYQIILALYEETTGRLPVDGGDHMVVGDLIISPAQNRVPVALLPMQHRVNRQLGPVTLLGYTAHRQGMAHAPEAPVRPGDQVEFTFYWQAPPAVDEVSNGAWPPDLHYTLQLGETQLTLPLASSHYPTAAWQAGEIVRGKAILPYAGGSRTPVVSVDQAKLRLATLPGATWWQW